MSELIHKKFLLKAVKLAERNILSGKGGPFGAVIVKDGKVISSAANKVTSSNDPTAHAEIVAIRKACKKLKSFQLTDCVIYSSCEPCPMCLSAIYWARLNCIYFAADRHQAATAGFDDSLIYKQIPLHPENRLIPGIHIPLTQSEQVFIDWIKSEKKITY